MSSATLSLRFQLNRIQLHRWSSRSQTLFKNCHFHSTIQSNLRAPEIYGSVFLKHNLGHSYLKRKVTSGIWQKGDLIVEGKFRNFKQAKDLTSESISSCPLRLYSSKTLTSHQICYSASVTQNIGNGFHTNSKPRSCQQNGRGFHTQCGLLKRPGLLLRSIQTCRSKFDVFRYISISTMDQKKKEGLKVMDAEKELEKKGDKSRKTIRKKVQPIIRQVPCQVTVYAVGNELDFTSFKKHLAEEQLFDVSSTPEDLLNKVIHVTSRYQPDNYPKKDIFFFSEGSVVFWNVLEDERLNILKNMKEHCMEINDMKLIMDESDSLEIQPTKLDTFLNNDVININEDQEAPDLILVKYAFSNALSQSVKLSIWETELYRHSQECEHISEALRIGSDVRMRKQKILKTLGAIFAIRQSMNLGSELLDTPDFYWDRDKLGDLYKQCYNHLCVPHRIKVMNEKMSYCIELLELIKDLESDKRHIRLEWIIILLIALEVVLELRKEIFK
ncbi:required for meiotic nuclear division protein 1 homolog [Pecten maximus]|uniref:required for meiotic nuclear division protein 1 homolog n=1 Tax=Pecten maximus TaxID=6579 RepID=UPI0014589E40|nr:required for meiotic nuclear division protein 1 homolog [Pecten maximus]